MKDQDQDQDQVSLPSDFLSVGSLVQHKSIHVSKKVPSLPQKVFWDFFQRRIDPCSVGRDEVFVL